MILAQVFHDIKTNGRRYVFTGGGDSTFNRGNGFGEWGAFLEQAKAHAPCIGGLGGMNVNGSGMNYLWAMKRQGNTAVGATTAPADPECLGGIVNPSGWTGFLHCLLAAAGTTISSTNWNWTANASFINAHGRVVASMFTRDLSGAADANTGYAPVISGGSTLDVSASQSGTRQAVATTGTKSITSVSVANPTTITTSAAHGYATGDKVVITGTNTSATTVGTFTATVTGATTFTIPVNVTSVTTGTGSVSRYNAITSARQISAISIHASAPEITTDEAHGYTTGNTVVLSSTNSTPAIDGSHVITVTSPTTFTVPTTTTGAGTAGFANNTSLSGTLRRIDMESEQITATAATGIGASFCIGSSDTLLGGPLLSLYVAMTVKDTPKGWWASKHISLGGKALYDYIEEGLSTANYANSIETYFKCMLLLNDPTYANSYGGCQGDVTPGGLGGADLAIGCLWVDCFMHNDVGSAGNICSFVPDGEESWAAEATGKIVAHDTGAGTVTLDAGQGASFDTSGHIKTAAGEIITYTGKSTDTLTGCTFATFGTTAEPRDTFACYQGYLSYTATGFAANNHFWDDWLRARWAAAGGAAANFKRILKASMPVIDEVASTAGVVSTLPQREQRHRDMVAAVRSRSPSPLFEVVDPRDTITARDMVVNRWADVNATATLGASGVTSTAGDTINCGAGLSTSGVGRIGNEAFKWTGKSGNNPTGCTRGAFGTTAYDTGTPSHTSGREIVDLDMIHSSTMGYQEFWRRKLLAELGSSSSIFELEGL